MGVESGDSSGYIDYGGGGDYAPDYGLSDMGVGGDSSTVDYASLYASPPTDTGPVADQFYYDPSTGNVLDTGLEQQTGTDLVGAFFDYYSAQGYDDQTALQMAVADASPSIVQETTSAQAPPPDLPDMGQYFPLPYTGPDYWQSPPYVPNFPEGPTPPPPSGPAAQKLGPCNTPTGLPGYCPQGQYHPTSDPCSCVPFPAATTQGGAPAPAPSSPPQRPRPSGPPAPVPSCPPGYTRNPLTLQCQPAQGAQPQCPAPYVYNAALQRCVIPQALSCPPGQAWDASLARCSITSGVPPSVSLLPAPTQPGAGDLSLTDLSKIPLWLWLALGGFLLLNMGGDSKSTTVTYRRR